jgi:hypothetical protein
MIRHEVKVGARNGITDFALKETALHELWVSQKGRCAVSGVQMTHKVAVGLFHPTNGSVDRINNALGYIEGNVRLVCRIVNIMKHTLTDSELKKWCKAIINYTV